MSIEGNSTSQTGSSAPTSFSYTDSYNVVYASSTTYKVDINEAESGESFQATAWILNNGTTIALDVSGENLTGSEVSDIGIGLFAGFILQIEEDSNIGLYTATSYFHSTGTSTVAIGPTEVSVTTYAANTLPETFSECGTSTTLTAFSFSVGTPQGATAPLVIAENIAGSDTVNGQTTTYTYELQVTSITLA